MADKAQLQQELAQLYEARTKLLTGSRHESVRFGDRQISYSSVDMNRLDARIRTIEAQLGHRQARRPFGVAL